MIKLHPFTIAQQQLDTAAARLGLDRATHELLRWPQKELVVTIPVQMDDGSSKIFRGYRVQHNGARGPCKGGLRWHPDETIAREHHPAVITGKPLPLGGSEGRGDATARHGMQVTREAAKALDLHLAGKAMAIHGFGSAGQHAALLGEEMLGLKLVAASDCKGGIANPKGLPARQVVGYKLGVFVLPDFLANAGGVTVSSFAQVQNTYNFYWSRSEVWQRLDETMARAFHGVYQMRQKQKVPMRLAAYLVSVARVAEVCKRPEERIESGSEE